MKARQESKAFSKLTNELATPPTKLYSPFNIYTDSSVKASKSRRKLVLNGNKGDKDKDCSMSSADETPKSRIVLRHKRHLMQANRFTFDSPTGRLRETVKDVERFQQCIEDISDAIRSRERSR